MASDEGGDAQKCRGLIDVLIGTDGEGKEVDMGSWKISVSHSKKICPFSPFCSFLESE